MEVIRHNHKLMQQKAFLATILHKNIQQKLSHAIGLECAQRPAVAEFTNNVRVDGATAILTRAKESA